VTDATPDNDTNSFLSHSEEPNELVRVGRILEDLPQVESLFRVMQGNSHESGRLNSYPVLSHCFSDACTQHAIHAEQALAEIGYDESQLSLIRLKEPDQ
jgi:hypothetical protein